MIIYLHGFKSQGVGFKSQVLIDTFGQDNVIAPDLPVDPDEVENLISGIVRTNSNYPLIFVGTSLGGFWANYFSQKWDTPGVLINPLTNPSTGLKHYIGQENYSSSGKEIIITQNILNKFKIREQFILSNTAGSRINLFLAINDEIIPYQNTISAMPYRQYLCIKNDGGHKFTKHWNEVIKRIEELIIPQIPA